MTQPRRMPLCHPQRRVFFSEVIAPGTGVGNLAGAVHWPGNPADLPRLHDAIRRVVRRHDALRLCLVEAEGPFCEQVLGPAPEVEAPTWELGEDRAPLLEESQRPFPLYGAPLFRFRLLHLPGGRIGYFFVYHHIFIDAWSVSLLNRQILAAFRGEGEPAEVPSFLEFLARERAWLQSPERAEEEAFWHAHFAGMAEPGAAAPRGPIATRRYEHAFEPQLSAQIVALAKAQGTSVFRFFLALFALHQSRMGRQDEVVLATGHHNRLDARDKEMAGMLVSTLPMRLGVRRNGSFADLLREAHATSTACLARQRYPYDLLSTHLRAQGHDPVRLLACVVNHVPSLPGGEGDADGALAVERYSPGADLAELDIKINPNQRPRSAPLELGVDARLTLYDADAMRALFARIEHLAREVVARPDTPVAALTHLPATERSVLAGPARPIAGDLVTAFLAATARWPARTALVDAQGERSYAALLAEVEGLAGRLQAAGVAPGDRVAVICGRSAACVVGLLAALRAGAAWIPLAADTPAPRVAQILAEADVRVVVSDTPRELPAPLVTVMVGGAPAPATRVVIDPEQEAYILFTSGSTGRPKGARVPHRAALNMAAWSHELWALAPEDRVAAYCSFAFDVSVAELLVPLLAGAAVVVVPEEARRDVHALARFYERHGISVSFLPTRVGELLMDHAPPATLRLLLVGGEALRPREKPAFRLLNAYGPTEACVYVSAWELRGDEADVPIGHLGPNIRGYVVDEEGAPVARGEIGELWLAGAQVALGYVGGGRGAFGPNPFAGGAHDGEVYRTGDLARVLPDGALAFHGRRDRQLKLRGIRVEPAELEACLVQFPGVDSCAVLPGGEGLVAFVAGGAAPGRLLEHARAHLPEFMVPARIVPVAGIPLTPGGKTDARALEALAQAPAPAALAPRSAREEAVLALFRRVLARPDLGVTDAFFEHGGDSLKAMELFAALERELGVSPSPALVFRNPTPAGLARALSTAAGAEARVQLSDGPGAALHCVHDFTGDLMAYTHLVCALDDAFPIHGLRWAPGLGDEAASLEELAATYLEHVRAVQPAGPYRLLGYSIGGTIAWEMARQLQERGERVALLALVDTPNYAQDAEPLDHFLRMASRSALSWLRGMSLTYKLAFVTTGLRRLHTLQRVFALIEAQRRMRALAQRYQPGPLPCPVLLLRSLARRPGLGPDLGWGALAAALEVVEIGGDHITIMDERRAVLLARVIRERQRAG
ncbi:MAG: amino acid adenylation domain-containing protein [Pseudomonadota bacterium]